MLKRILTAGALTSLLVVASGCVSAPPPYEEFTLARAAVNAARAYEAPKHAPGYWHKAKEFYIRGERAYKESDFGVAHDNFKKARAFAEKAENATRLKKFQTGDRFL